MRTLLSCLALLGAALLGFGVVRTVSPPRVTVETTVLVVRPAPAPAPKRRLLAARPHVPAHVHGTAVVVVRQGTARPRPFRPDLLAPVAPAATPSSYQSTTSPKALREQGCVLGRRAASGLVILDFGKLSFRARAGGYGTLTFGGRFAPNRAITRALEAFARGYAACLPHGSKARIVLARGTSNFRQNVPSTYAAGRLWAAETEALAGRLARLGLARHVESAAADDVEPAWDRGFRRTRDFFRGFRDARSGRLLYNYGSLDGGAGGIWSERQDWFVAAGLRDVRVVPEIYNHAMARQWAELARLAAVRFGRPVVFAGLMTQHSERCRSCGFTSSQAHDALVRELRRHPATHVRNLGAATNIGVPHGR